MSVTSAPASVAPSMNAAASGSEDAAHVVSDDQLLRAGEMRERVTDPAHERLVDLRGIHAANVVRLEDSVERHAAPTNFSESRSGLRAGSW